MLLLLQVIAQQAGPAAAAAAVANKPRGYTRLLTDAFMCCCRS
jgi:hypothetical protein